MRLDRLPLTYEESRCRFRRAATASGALGSAHAIVARGPEGQRLTIDTATVGPEAAPRRFLVLSGVHGVEGYVCSALQADLLERVARDGLPDHTSVTLVHAVNPWGMAWWRRQNESNVDLNRNWGRDQMTAPPTNAAYEEMHPLACPDTVELPDIAALLVATTTMVREHGIDWVRDGITTGQYIHPDGLHFGGDRTEESNRILEEVLPPLLSGAERVLVTDLHTGHGPSREITILSSAPEGSGQDAFLRTAFPAAAVDATSGKPGQIAAGLASVIDGASVYAETVEIGTATDEEQLAATYHEQWVHRRGDRADPAHAAAIWAYRCCFTPDDRGWEQAALTAGQRHLDDALIALSS